MEEQDCFSGDSCPGSGIGHGTVPANNSSPSPPGYLISISLGFKLIMTLLIWLMAGWVFTTIKTTRRLHKPHNIFVVNLMISTMVLSLPSTILSSIMMIGHITAVGDFISCNVYFFLLFPSLEIYFSYFMTSLDKLIVIMYPFKHREIMTPRVVKYAITASWFLSVALFINKLFIDSSGYRKVAVFGSCIPLGSTNTEIMLTHTIPIFVASILTIAVDAYLSYIGYQVSKQIQREARLSGTSCEVAALQRRHAAIKRNLKPMMTLLVVVLGSTIFGVLVPLLYVPVHVLEYPTSYLYILESTVVPNMGYIVLLMAPIVYGLYYKQVREPMIMMLKTIIPNCKFRSAVVAPLPQRSS
ncbi:galanin receptor 2a-like [Dysidea avara]|uniref:galanin receptor 2a-like n=1 Tax=Dysidea avara TaxID=196820 RepID=UPI0033270B40